MLLCTISYGQQRNLRYEIDGIVDKPLQDSVNKLYLSYLTDTGYVRDSVTVNNGRFKFNGTLTEITEARLIASYNQLTPLENQLRAQKDSRPLYIGEGPIMVNISSSLKAATVSGSDLTSEMDVYNAHMQRSIENNEAVYQQTRKDPADEARRAKRRAALDAVEEAKKTFITAHPRNSFALGAMKDAIQVYQNRALFTAASDSLYKQLAALYNQLSIELRESSQGSELATRLAELSTRKLPHFSGPSLAGGTLDINQYKGKVFLIDFWGSWCIWCRKGHPHLKEVYEKFKPKGFEIIGVGVEFDKDRTVGERKLREAIAKDGITWPQIFNVNDGDNDLRKIFSIYAYPTKILVDQSGNIVLRVTDDEERKLDAKLEELLGK